MKVYRTRHPAERFNIRWAPKKGAFRLAARGRSVYITPDEVAAAVELASVLIVTVSAFRAGKAVAFAERGYPRVKAALGNDSAATKADSITFGTTSTTFTVFACNSGEWRITEEFDTEAEARSWVDEQLAQAGG